MIPFTPGHTRFRCHHLGRHVAEDNDRLFLHQRPALLVIPPHASSAWVRRSAAEQLSQRGKNFVHPEVLIYRRAFPVPAWDKHHQQRCTRREGCAEYCCGSTGASGIPELYEGGTGFSMRQEFAAIRPLVSAGIQSTSVERLRPGGGQCRGQTLERCSNGRNVLPLLGNSHQITDFLKFARLSAVPGPGSGINGVRNIRLNSIHGLTRGNLRTIAKRRRDGSTRAQGLEDGPNVQENGDDAVRICRCGGRGVCFRRI